MYLHFLFSIIVITIGPDVLVNADRGGKSRVKKPNSNQNYHRQEKQQQELVETLKSRKAKKTKPIRTIEEEINRSRIPKVRNNVTFFEPIVLKFPDTPQRTDKEAELYKEKTLKPFGSRAIDKNLIMTGKICARGRGTLYDVLVSTEIVIFRCN